MPFEPSGSTKPQNAVKHPVHAGDLLHRKLLRETLRLLRTPSRAMRELWDRFTFGARLDRLSAVQTRLTPGAKPERAEVAIYLIFPSDGIAWSHLDAISRMDQAGIEVHVVSNLPLSEADREKLQPICRLVMERPNIGYDFGGYRAGILALGQRLQVLDRLWLINDSVWMVPQPQDWFAQARSLATDFAGATMHKGVKRVPLARAGTLEWRHDPRRRDFHYASYALAIGPRILKDPGFSRFWTRLQVRNDKKRTVRNGEIGLSRFVIKNGFSHGATCDLGNLPRDLDTLAANDIDRIARDLMFIDNRTMSEFKTAVLSTDAASLEGRRRRIDLILNGVARQGSAYALAAHAIGRLGFQFLKKSPMVLDGEAASITMRIIDGLPGAERIELAREAAALEAKAPWRGSR
jgi:hypothetical protein